MPRIILKPIEVDMNINIPQLRGRFDGASSVVYFTGREIHIIRNIKDDNELAKITNSHICKDMSMIIVFHDKHSLVIYPLTISELIDNDNTISDTFTSFAIIIPCSDSIKIPPEIKHNRFIIDNIYSSYAVRNYIHDKIMDDGLIIINNSIWKSGSWTISADGYYYQQPYIVESNVITGYHGFSNYIPQVYKCPGCKDDTYSSEIAAHYILYCWKCGVLYSKYTGTTVKDIGNRKEIENTFGKYYTSEIIQKMEQMNLT